MGEHWLILSKPPVFDKKENDFLGGEKKHLKKNNDLNVFFCWGVLAFVMPQIVKQKQDEERAFDSILFSNKQTLTYCGCFMWCWSVTPWTWSFFYHDREPHFANKTRTLFISNINCISYSVYICLSLKSLNVSDLRVGLINKQAKIIPESLSSTEKLCWSQIQSHVNAIN